MKKISFYTGPARERTRPTARARGPLGLPPTRGTDRWVPAVSDRGQRGGEPRAPASSSSSEGSSLGKPSTPSRSPSHGASIRARRTAWVGVGGARHRERRPVRVGWRCTAAGEAARSQLSSVRASLQLGGAIEVGREDGERPELPRPR
jgi:hypothetical protein